MAKGRSTIDVLHLLQKANRIFALDVGHGGGVEFRLGIASFLEDVLLTTGNYEGFGYLLGYHPNANGVSHDESRRVYHFSRRMRLALAAKTQLECDLAAVGAL